MAVIRILCDMLEGASKLGIRKLLGDLLEIPGSIQFIEKSSVREVLWICRFRSGYFFTQLIQHDAKTLQRRIGLYRYEFLKELIRLFQLSFIADSHVFAQGDFGELGIASHDLIPST